MTIATYETAAHVAMLNPLAGAGLLVIPKADDDMWIGADSVHGSDWDSITTALFRQGWVTWMDEWDLPVELVKLPDGRIVYALYPLLDDAMEIITEADEIAYKRALMELIGEYQRSLADDR